MERIGRKKEKEKRRKGLNWERTEARKRVKIIKEKIKTTPGREQRGQGQKEQENPVRQKWEKK